CRGSPGEPGICHACSSHEADPSGAIVSWLAGDGYLRGARRDTRVSPRLRANTAKPPGTRHADGGATPCGQTASEYGTREIPTGAWRGRPRVPRPHARPGVAAGLVLCGGFSWGASRSP